MSHPDSGVSSAAIIAGTLAALAWGLLDRTSLAWWAAGHDLASITLAIAGAAVLAVPVGWVAAVTAHPSGSASRDAILACAFLGAESSFAAGRAATGVTVRTGAVGPDGTAAAVPFVLANGPVTDATWVALDVVGLVAVAGGALFGALVVGRARTSTWATTLRVAPSFGPLIRASILLQLTPPIEKIEARALLLRRVRAEGAVVTEPMWWLPSVELPLQLVILVNAAVALAAMGRHHRRSWARRSDALVTVLSVLASAWLRGQMGGGSVGWVTWALGWTAAVVVASPWSAPAPVLKGTPELPGWSTLVLTFFAVAAAGQLATSVFLQGGFAWGQGISPWLSTLDGGPPPTREHTAAFMAALEPNVGFVAVNVLAAVAFASTLHVGRALIQRWRSTAWSTRTPLEEPRDRVPRAPD